ncbi:hypothetical protein PR048_025112 [Dryococelus australis]|uniref:Uncharacterized protein n=1 Tax=Dryococelus australis TaxID=614101 RepID=A0ABQ9GQI9_9NEOP|nr:hypothetical protein PR048_025112 [Dryococelus australis]
MLSDLYIPADTDPLSPELSTTLEEGVEDGRLGEEEEEVTGPTSVALETLCQAGKLHCKKSPRGTRRGSAPQRSLCVDVQERCCMALQQVVAGLQCLQFFECDESDSKPPECSQKHVRTEEKHLEEEENQKMAYPFQAIPMPYASLSKPNILAAEPVNKNLQNISSKKISGSRRKKKDGRFAKAVPESHTSTSEKDTKTIVENRRNEDLEEQIDTSPKALLCKSNAEALPTWQQPSAHVNISWKIHLRTLLYEKARLVYATLAEHAFASECYGKLLRYVSAALRCHFMLEQLQGDAPSQELVSHLLTRVADACFMMAQHWGQIEHIRNDCVNMSDDDQYILRDTEIDGSVKGKFGLVKRTYEKSYFVSI